MNDERWIAWTWPIALCVVLTTIGTLPPMNRGVLWLWRALAALRRRPWVTLIALVAIISLLCGFPVMIGRAVPPAIHDEISNLLAADTFLHGRLTNPTPQFWQWYQTMHELMTPTYASKFPPGQGLLLAAGTLLGSPRIGPIVNLGLAAAATAWMLRARMSWRWSALGGMVAGTHPLSVEWANSFWGGGLAMLGGALLIGAVLRFASDARAARTIHWRLGVILGVGAAILANSRPFEGFLLAAILAAWLVYQTFRDRMRIAPLMRLAWPAALVLAPVVLWMGYYNYRVTGSAFRLPYAEHARQYMVAPVFWWQGTHQPEHDEIAHLDAFFGQFEVAEYRSHLSVQGFFLNILRKIIFVTTAASWPIAWLIILIGAWMALRRRRAARFAASVIVALFVLHLCFTPWLRTHYLAPLLPLWIALMVLSIRALRQELKWFQRKRSRRLVFNRSARLMRAAIAPALAAAICITQLAFAYQEVFAAASDPHFAGAGRQFIIDNIHRVPGKHLVFVYYTNGPQMFYEYVYNDADVENSDIIFAHYISDEQVRQMMQRFPDRSVWLITVANDQYRLDSKILRHAPTR